MDTPRFVSLEPAAWLGDADFQAFSASERGAYCTLCFYLYCNNGMVRLDEAMLTSLCKCTLDELQRVLHKFQIREGMCTHKRVQQELNKARKLMERGRKAAKARWDSELGMTKGHAQALLEQCPSMQTCNAKERNETKRDVTEEKRTSSNTKEPVPIGALVDRFASQIGPPSDSPSPSNLRVHSASPRFAFDKRLRDLIPAKTKSDVAAYRNLGDWLSRGIAEGRFTEDIFERALQHADPKKLKWANNKRAGFFHAIEEDLGYNPEHEAQRRKADGA